MPLVYRARPIFCCSPEVGGGVMAFVTPPPTSGEREQIRLARMPPDSSFTTTQSHVLFLGFYKQLPPMKFLKRYPSLTTDCKPPTEVYNLWSDKPDPLPPEVGVACETRKNLSCGL